jgi:hypothetical protein
MSSHLNAKDLAMPTDITSDLPQVIADHIAACNAHDADAWMATFARTPCQYPA